MQGSIRLGGGRVAEVRPGGTIFAGCSTSHLRYGRSGALKYPPLVGGALEGSVRLIFREYSEELSRSHLSKKPWHQLKRLV